MRPDLALRGPGMFQGGLRVIVEQVACRHEMACDEVGGIAVQSGEFAADFGGQLSGFDVRRQRRAATVR